MEVILATDPSRVLNGVITRHEKWLLIWMAERLPKAVVPDHLTLVGIAGAFLVAVSLAASHLSLIMLPLALLGLALNWVGDSLDGTLARVRRIERPRYGFFLDHLSDVLSQLLIVLGLGLSPFLRFDIVCLGLIAYLVMSLYTFVKLHVSRTMQLTYFGVGPTEVRVLIGFGIILAGILPPMRFATIAGSMSVFDVATLVIVAFALLSVAVTFSRDLAIVAAVDPPRDAPPQDVVMVDLTTGVARR